MAGPDYRQLQAPAQVETSLPDSGAAGLAGALAGAFKEFNGIATNVYNKASAQAGALAGAASGNTGHPDYKTGLTRFTAYSTAFNNAATGAYAVEAEAQADADAARLRVQANNDPDAFRATYTAARDATVKAAPAMAQPMLMELYNRHLAAGLGAISGDQATEDRAKQRAVYDFGVQRAVSKVAALQGSANPEDQLAAQDEHVKLSLLIDGGVTAGLYSKAEAQSLHVSSMVAVTEQVFETQVDKELDRPDGDPLRLIDSFRSAHLANLAKYGEAVALPEAEFQKLMGNAILKLKEYNLVQAGYRKQGKTEEQLRFEAGDALYTSRALVGQTNAKELSEAVQRGDLKSENARAIVALLEGGSSAKSNKDLYFKLHTSPDFVNMTPADIAKYVGPGGLNGKDADTLAQEAMKRREGWEGTAAAKQGKGAIDAALKILPGTPAAALSEEQLRMRTNAQQEYISLMNAEEPAKRNSMAAQHAQTAIAHAQQKAAAEQVTQYTQGKASFITRYGPGGAEHISDEAYQRRLKQYDDNITQARAASKGTQ